MDRHEEPKSTSLLFSDHPRPLTRRQFLSQGLISYSASMFVPSVFSMAFGSKSVFAEGSIGADVPFLVFDLAGGAAMPANFLVGGAGGPEDLLKSYDTLGWDPRAGGSLDRSFGLPLAAANGGGKDSKILAGILATASEGARHNLRMGSFCHFSQDDSSNNKTSAVALVAKAGLRGHHIPNGLGQNASLSGGNSEAIGAEPLYKPLQIKRVTDVTESLSYGPGLKDFPSAALRALGLGARRLSALQNNKLDKKQRGNELGQATDKAHEANLVYAEGVKGVDPRQEEQFKTIYGLNEVTGPDNADAVKASIVMNVLKRNVGPGVITIGGCDYHDSTQTTGDNKDLEIGREIGRAVEAAHQLGKPLFFQILTDGGVYAKDGKREWIGDSGDRSLSVVGFYNPKGASNQPRLQVGRYTDGQGIDRDSLVGSDPVKAAYAVFANYLNVCGRLGDFEKVAPRGVFTPQELDSLLVFS